MKCVKISPEDWKVLSEKAHLIVFNEKKPSDFDRIDFTLMVESFLGVPMQYVTCQELDASSLYWQYGGSFPSTKGTVHSLRAFQLLLRWAKEQRYERVGFRVENDNYAMLKLAMKCGFKVIGIRVFGKHTLLEHMVEL